MKVTFLVTGSQPDPIPGKRHAAFCVESASQAYLFDVGEGTSPALLQAGINPLSLCGIFLTHSHYGHMGGLAPLLWDMRQLHANSRDGDLFPGMVNLYMPHILPWHGLLDMLAWSSREPFARDYVLGMSIYRDGLVHQDDACTVQALHNTHSGKPLSGADWRSYSLRIEIGGKCIVYGGDAPRMQELLPLLDSPCDLLVLNPFDESVGDACTTLSPVSSTIGCIYYQHYLPSEHAVADGLCQQMQDALETRVVRATDGMTVEL